MSIHQHPAPVVSGGSRVRELLEAVRHNLWLAIAVFLTVVSLGAFLTWRAEPVYQSGSTLRLEEDNMGSRLQLSAISPLGGGARGALPTELAVMRSRHVAEEVVDSLGLQVLVREPSGPRSAVLEEVAAGRNVQPGRYRLTRDSGGGYQVAWAGTGAAPAVPSHFGLGERLNLDGASFALAPAVRADPPAEIVIEVIPFRDAVDGVRRHLTVSRADPLADIISVQFESPDPILAAAVPNVAANSYIRYKTRASRTETRSSVDFLQSQVESYEQQLLDAEGRLRIFREQAQVVSLVDEASEQVKRLASLQARRDELTAERRALADLLNQVRSGQAGTSYRQLASFPVFLSNLAIQNILQSLTTLETQRSELLVLRTAENPDVRGVNARIAELEGQLFQTATSYLAGLDNQISSINANLATFGEQLERIPAREVEFARLQRQQRLLEEIYTLLQTRLKEQEIQQAVVPGDVRVLDTALVPQRPISPRPMRNMALAVTLGLFLGLAAAFGREALDTKVRDKADVQAVTSGAAVLGVIPRIKVAALANGNGKLGNGKGKGNALVRRLKPQQLLEERLVTHLAPRDPASEAYRALRTNITFAGSGKPPQVLVMTSAMPGDGKSTSAANLAITLAMQGTKTLLIDTDLRLGLLNEVFAVRSDPGLSHVLLGKATFEDAVTTIEGIDSQVPLHFLATGVFPPNPAELLGSPAMAALMTRLREQYDTIILDAPPVNLVTDAAVVSQIADSTIMVVRSGVTDRRAIEHAMSQLQQLRVSVGGIILNDVDLVGDNRYYGTYGYGV
jgi:capsular exopolysaccharide synthesis family protein